MHRRRAVVCMVVLCCLLSGCSISPDPLVGQSHQSSCREVRDVALGDADVELQVNGRNLTILHRNALTNCCLTTAMEVVLEANTIEVFEREQPGEACRCLCSRDLSVTIYYLSAGLYSVKIYRDDEPESFWAGMVQIK